MTNAEQEIEDDAEDALLKYQRDGSQEENEKNKEKENQFIGFMEA